MKSVRKGPGRLLEHNRGETDEARQFRREVAEEVLREIAAEWLRQDREELTCEELLKLLVYKMRVGA